MIDKKPHISLAFSILVVPKQLKYSTDMHNLKTIFDKTFDIYKQFSSDLGVIVLSFTSESLSIDGENYLFNKLEAEYQRDFLEESNMRLINPSNGYYYSILTTIFPFASLFSASSCASAISFNENTFAMTGCRFFSFISLNMASMACCVG